MSQKTPKEKIFQNSPEKYGIANSSQYDLYSGTQSNDQENYKSGKLRAFIQRLLGDIQLDICKWQIRATFFHLRYHLLDRSSKIFSSCRLPPPCPAPPEACPPLHNYCYYFYIVLSLLLREISISTSQPSTISERKEVESVEGGGVGQQISRRKRGGSQIRERKRKGLDLDQLTPSNPPCTQIDPKFGAAAQILFSPPWVRVRDEIGRGVQSEHFILHNLPPTSLPTMLISRQFSSTPLKPRIIRHS